MRLLPSITVAALVAVALAGCLPPEPVAARAWAPSSPPVFASEEEALAAAAEAYAGYLQMSDLIASEGGANPERLADFVTASQLEVELEGFAVYADNGWATNGTSSFDQFTLQSFSPSRTIGAELSAYACYDISQIRIIDAAGKDVSPSDVPDRQMLELVFETDGTSSQKFLLESAGIWDSSGC